MKPQRSFTIVLILASAIFLLSCSKDKADLSDNASGRLHANAAIARVNIQNSAFNPDDLYLEAPATVTWLNNEDAIHTVTSNNGTFDSGDLQPGATFSYSFSIKGGYGYHCKYHAQEIGLIRLMVMAK